MKFYIIGIVVKMDIKKLVKENIGIFYMLLASVLFAITGAFAKVLSADLPSIEVVFFRNFVGLILIVLALMKNRPVQRGGQFGLLVFRGVIGAFAILAFFYNIAHTDLATAFTYSKTSPIFIALISAIFLKQKVSSKAWFSILLGFVGIIIIMRPTIGISKTDIMGIASGLGAALAYTSVFELKKAYDPKVIVLSFMISGTLLPLLCMIMYYLIPSNSFDFILSPFVMPNFKNLIFIILMGVFGIFFQVYMTKAYASSKKAFVISAISYSDVVFSMMLGAFLGDGFPKAIGFLGIILVILSGILVANFSKDRK